MCNTCLKLERDPWIVGFSDKEDCYRQCLRPEGHQGPHLIQRHSVAGGAYVIFRLDVCTGKEYALCPGCQSDDPHDWCQVYREVDKQTAQRYILDPAFEEDW